MVELIPRAVLFGNPARLQARVSPDGKRISFLAPSEQGILNVWVRPLDRAEAVQVTDDRHRGIRQHLWSHDGRHVLYLQDTAGDEDWHVHRIDVQSRSVEDLTPFQGVRAQNLMLSRRRPGELLVALNLRDRQLFDVHRIELASGRIELDTENPGDVAEWRADAELEVRAALALAPSDGSIALRVRDRRGAEWRELLVWPFGENGDVAGFSGDGRTLHVKSSLGSDTMRLVELDVASGRELRALLHDVRADVDRVLVHPESHAVQAASVEYLEPQWTVLDPSVREDFDVLRRARPGDFEIVGRDHADRLWAVAYQTPDASVAYTLYDRAERRLELLFVGRPELDRYTLAPVRSLVLPARDGLPLVSYLTLPPAVEPCKLPLVLLVHGGPWARDHWGLDVEAQWLANRGYAVLQVNFRASTGFGKRFQYAGTGQWGTGRMQDDLTDAVLWAVEQGIADPARVGIYGGSYGGYATLAGLCFTPELYACGVDIVGPSHLATFLASIPPYWAPFKKQLLLQIGDPENDEPLNRERSPLFHVERIRAPLFIAQGANDPRVKIHESDQIAAAVRARGLVADYVVYTDEGHGFARPENRLDFYGRVEQFLARHLGGRAEPFSAVPGASAQFR